MKINRGSKDVCSSITLQDIKHVHPFRLAGQRGDCEKDKVYIKVYPLSSSPDYTIGVGHGKLLVINLERGSIDTFPINMRVIPVDYDFSVGGDSDLSKLSKHKRQGHA